MAPMTSNEIHLAQMKKALDAIDRPNSCQETVAGSSTQQMQKELATTARMTLKEIYRAQMKEALDAIDRRNASRGKPTPRTLFPAASTDEDADMAAFLARPTEPVDLAISRYMYMKCPREVEREYNWKDTEPGVRICLNLLPLSLDKIDSLGLQTFSDLESSISMRTIAGLFILAYNLTSVDRHACFGEVHPSLFNSVDLVDLEGVNAREVRRVFADEDFALIPRTTDYSKEMQIRCWAYSYLACSYMRLFTSSSEDFSQIGDELSTQFEIFYGVAIPLRNFHPPLFTIRAVKYYLEQSQLLKNTFYNFLYAGENCPNGKNLKEFLYETHVSFHGLQPYTFYVRCMETLKVSNVYLATAMEMGKFENELKALQKVFDNLACNQSEDYRLSMWKYARIFDPAFLYDLQTKRCLFFTMVLAQLRTLIIPAGELKNALIAHISDINYDRMMEAKLYAERIYLVIEFQKTQSMNKNPKQRSRDESEELY